MTRSDTSHRPLARLTCKYCTCMSWMSLVFYMFLSLPYWLTCMHVLLASCCLLPPHPVFTSSNQSCSTEHEGERGECAAHPNYFLSAKSTPRVHEPLLVPCKIFTLPYDRLQLVELTSTTCWAPESKPEHTSRWAQEHCSSKENFCRQCAARLFRVLPPLKCVARVSYPSSVSPHHPVAESSCSAAHFFFLPNQVSLFLPV
jgi:hypothetical protein